MKQLGVDVRLAVGGVGEAVHALAGARVVHVGLDAQLVVAGGQAGEGVAGCRRGGGVERPAVEADGAQGFGGLELDEGVTGRAGGEPDDGAGSEGSSPG